MLLAMLCSCGIAATADEPTTEPPTPSTITAGEAAQKASESAEQVDTDADAGDADAQDTEPGTEDSAIDAVRKAAENDIKGFDGKWQNLSIEVDDPIAVIDFDWGDKHYQYKYDEDAGKMVE